MSQLRLCEVAGCDVDELAEVEAGRRRASGRLLSNLAGALDVDLSYFFSEIAATRGRHPLPRTHSATVIPFRRDNDR